MTKMRFKPHWIPPECFRWPLKLRIDISINGKIHVKQNADLCTCLSLINYLDCVHR